jgi:hypothetical protein
LETAASFLHHTRNWGMADENLYTKYHINVPTMKSFFTSLLLLIGLVPLALAQNILVTPNDSVLSNILPSRAAEQHIEFLNTSNQAITLRWTVTTQTFPSAWFVTLCDNGECHTLPYSADTMRTIQPGDTSFFHLTAVPYNVPGSLLVQVHLWDTLQPSTAFDVTFIVNANGTAVAPNVLKQNVSISPSPANTRLHLRARNGALEKGTVKLYDLEGHIVLSQPVAALSENILDTQKLAPGIYLLRYESKAGSMTEKVVISH